MTLIVTSASVASLPITRREPGWTDAFLFLFLTLHRRIGLHNYIDFRGLFTILCGVSNSILGFMGRVLWAIEYVKSGIIWII